MARKPTPAKAAAKAPPKRVFQRTPNTLTVTAVIAALRAGAGIRAIAAEKLKVNRSTITRFIAKHPEIEEIEAEIVDELVDLSEGKLIGLINSGEFPAIKYFLDNKGGKAGYGRRLEVTGAGGGPIRTAAEYDYSKLSVEELRQLETTLAKLEPSASRVGKP